MSSSGRTRELLLVCCLFGAACGCARSSGRNFERLAVVRFENLTGDPAQDWAAAAVPVVLASQLTGSPSLKVLDVAAVRDLAGSGATLALEGYISIESGKLTGHAFLEDLRTGRRRKTFQAADARGGGPLSVADALARSIDAGAKPFGTRNTAALRAYVEALAGGPGADAALERATAADPDFGNAYLTRAQLLLGRGDRAGAAQVFASARQRYGSIGAYARAQLDVLSELLTGTYESRRHALIALSRVIPADGTVFARLGSLDAAARQFPSAVEWYRQALERDPSDPLLLNEAGYAQAFAGDLDGAVTSLRKYASLRPADANPLDSLGDVHYLAGRFRDAERFYLEAHAKDPGFSGGAGELAKATQARLMDGDPAGASATFARYLDARKALGDPLLEYRRAQWDFLRGEEAQAAATLDRLAAGSNPASWLALVQLSALSLDSGRREAARQYAARAAAAPGGRHQVLPAISVFLSQPSAPAGEWQARAERTFGGSAPAGLKTNALALALLFDRHFREAVPVLRQIYRETAPSSPEPAGVWLAWALVESGQAAEAKEALALYPLPQPNREQPFGVLAARKIASLRTRAGLK